jgi:hypothetical protein
MVTELHELKTWPDAFEAIERGAKHHEVRKNDRRFVTGDLLQLREWDPSTEAYTGRERTVRVSYVSYGGAWGLPDDICVMSIERRDDPNQIALDTAQRVHKGLAKALTESETANDALRAEVTALRAALRERDIGKKWDDDDACIVLECARCERTWPINSPESHAPGCLAAEVGCG